MKDKSRVLVCITEEELSAWKALPEETKDLDLESGDLARKREKLRQGEDGDAADARERDRDAWMRRSEDDVEDEAMGEKERRNPSARRDAIVSPFKISSSREREDLEQ